MEVVVANEPEKGLEGTQPPHHHVATVLDDVAGEPVDELERLLGCGDCGLRLLGLLISSPAWVRRRVESVAFRDHRTVRRRVSVDFEIPVSAPLFTINDTSYRLLPLTIMRRKSLINFDLRDEADASIPLLSIRQNQAITLALVKALACGVLGTESTSPSIDDFLRELVAGKQQELLDAWDHARGPDAPSVIKKLVNDKLFDHVMRRVAEDFVMFALVPKGPARRVFKFRYDEPLSRHYRESGSKENEYVRSPPRVSPWAREPIAAALGWRPTRIRFPTPAAENAASYHFEVHAPPGVEIDSAAILAGRPDEKKAGRPPSVDHVTGGFPTVDLHVIDVERGSLSRAQVDLRLAADSWLTLAAVTAWLSAGALYWAANRLGQPFNRENDAASALFITFAVALTAILWRPPEHRMAFRLLSTVGLLAYMPSLLLLIAAAIFVFERDKPVTGRLLVLGMLATVIGAVLTVTLVQVLRSVRRDKVLSPWEQGTRIGDIEDARHADAELCTTFKAASRHLGFTTPAIKVASAEADAAATLTLDDDLIAEMRALIAGRLVGEQARQPETHRRSTEA